jgi:hypothetical protein
LSDRYISQSARDKQRDILSLVKILVLSLDDVGTLDTLLVLPSNASKKLELTFSPIMYTEF